VAAYALPRAGRGIGVLALWLASLWLAWLAPDWFGLVGLVVLAEIAIHPHAADRALGIENLLRAELMVKRVILVFKVMVKLVWPDLARMRIGWIEHFCSRLFGG